MHNMIFGFGLGFLLGSLYATFIAPLIVDQIKKLRESKEK